MFIQYLINLQFSSFQIVSLALNLVLTTHFMLVILIIPNSFILTLLFCKITYR